MQSTHQEPKAAVRGRRSPGGGARAIQRGLEPVVSRLSRSRAFTVVVLLTLQLASLPPVAACVGELGAVVGLQCSCCPADSRGAEGQPEKPTHECCSSPAPGKRDHAPEGPELVPASPAGEACECGSGDDEPPTVFAKTQEESRGRWPAGADCADELTVEVTAFAQAILRLRAPPERALLARGGRPLRVLLQVFLL